ncbi:hypothetical protein D9M72_249600 [compost metagenome]
MVTELAGAKPPSPMPNSTRTTNSMAKVVAMPVAPVKTDQHATENTRMTRAPKRSPSQPAARCMSA